MNLEENRIWKQLQARLPWFRRAAGRTVSLRSPDGTLEISEAGTSEPGATGPQGPAGPAGADGNRIYFGTTPPTGSFVAGDFFLNTDTWDVYRFS